MFSARDRPDEQIRAEPNGNGNHVDENGKKRNINLTPHPLLVLLYNDLYMYFLETFQSLSRYFSRRIQVYITTRRGRNGLSMSSLLFYRYIIIK